MVFYQKLFHNVCLSAVITFQCILPKNDYALIDAVDFSWREEAHKEFRAAVVVVFLKCSNILCL